MALQNRVTPFGEIIATPERGAWMGNRGGRFHTEDRRLTRRRWVSKRWIVCVLAFRGRHRVVMSPDRYTELFFLDEATAFAAGHRPCRECRYADHERFKAAWLRGNADQGVAANASIDEIDAILHRERVTPTGAKVTFEARLDDLPEGVLVVAPDAMDKPLLIASGRLWGWSPAGYTDAGPRGKKRVAVLTPRSTVRAISAGYTPQWDDSASRQGGTL